MNPALQSTNMRNCPAIAPPPYITPHAKATAIAVTTRLTNPARSISPRDNVCAKATLGIAKSKLIITNHTILIGIWFTAGVINQMKADQIGRQIAVLISTLTVTRLKPIASDQLSLFVMYLTAFPCAGLS